MLLLRRGGLGDTLLSSAALRALRRRHPDAELHFAGVRDYGEILVAYGVVDRAWSSEDFALWSPSVARQRLAGFAHTYGDEPAIVQHSFEPRRIESGVPFGVQLARQLGLEPKWPEDGWLSPPRPAGDGPVVLAPGSGGRSKCWPRAAWIELAQRLAAAGCTLQLVVGPTEIERDDPRAWPWPRSLRPPIAAIVEPWPIGLAAQLTGARAFVGNDSGTTHLAAALGVPTVAVFVSTAPAVWAPAGPHVCVVGDGGGAPPVERVQAAVQSGAPSR